MFVHRIAVVLLGGCAASACYRGYKSAKELDSDDRGPKACVASCKDLGMQMSAFVLVERQTSGCVCSPLDKPASQATGVAAATAVTRVAVDAKKRDAAEQRQEQSTVAPP